MPTTVSLPGKGDHRILECQVGTDLKDHLVSSCLAKAQSRLDGLGPFPADRAHLRLIFNLPDPPVTFQILTIY